MKFLPILFLMIALNSPIYAQKLNFSFNHVAISVTDLERSCTFYKEVLKLEEITNKTKVEGIRWFTIGNGIELHLISTIKERVKINKAVHFALSTKDFDKFIQNLDGKKIPYSDWPGTPQKINVRADGIRQVFLQDPDGYWIEVNSVSQE